jgi:MOSC domain-containing protein YiiM
MTVERIFIGPAAGEPQVECESIAVVAGSGIEGDRYFGLHDEPGRNISLVEAEEIEAFMRERGGSGELSATRRNLVTRGIRLNELVGKEFFIGEVKLRGVELCEPCLGLGSALASPEQPAAAVVKRLLHRAGLRADVLSSGVIARGANVTTAPGMEP